MNSSYYFVLVILQFLMILIPSLEVLLAKNDLNEQKFSANLSMVFINFPAILKFKFLYLVVFISFYCISIIYIILGNLDLMFICLIMIDTFINFEFLRKYYSNLFSPKITIKILLIYSYISISALIPIFIDGIYPDIKYEICGITPKISAMNYINSPSFTKIIEFADKSFPNDTTFWIQCRDEKYFTVDFSRDGIKLKNEIWHALMVYNQLVFNRNEKTIEVYVKNGLAGKKYYLINTLDSTSLKNRNIEFENLKDNWYLCKMKYLPGIKTKNSMLYKN